MGEKVNMPMLMARLGGKMGNVEPLPEDEDFFTNSETLMRFLKARDWKLADAEKQLKATVEWRRVQRPLHADCSWCHERPGYHCLRQVGTDEQGRPVIYSCFSQASMRKITSEDSIKHCTFLIENAKKTMPPGVHQWVFVIDCTGMTIHSCNPKLGYNITQVMSNYYPERLGLVICLNHNPVFQGVWKTIKSFLHPNTVAKMQLVRSKKKVQEVFDKHFSPELTKWLQDEIKLNKQSPIPKSQREFWKAPENPVDHDPRGSPDYIKKYIEPHLGKLKAEGPLKAHFPHPNIVDGLRGKVASSVAIPVDDADDASVPAYNVDENETELNESDIPEMHIAEEYKIPKDAKPVFVTDF